MLFIYTCHIAVTLSPSSKKVYPSKHCTQLKINFRLLSKLYVKKNNLNFRLVISGSIFRLVVLSWKVMQTEFLAFAVYYRVVYNKHWRHFPSPQPEINVLTIVWSRNFCFDYWKVPLNSLCVLWNKDMDDEEMLTCYWG